MENFNQKTHWQRIYQHKTNTDVSWYQAKPKVSLSFFEKFNIPKNAKIIDIGGGDSLLVDNLLALGYTDITVLDISEISLQKAQQRLGSLANNVKWIVADVANFYPSQQYDFWHDRATFHFLTQNIDVQKYVRTISQHIEPLGVLVVGTFSDKGPKKCSGIEVKQYSKKSLVTTIGQYFKKETCLTHRHKTPFDTVQSFVFCSFTKVPLV